MIITLMSLQSQLLEIPILYLSPYLEKHKDEYIDRMYNVTTKSDWNDWVRFFLTCINATCKETIAKIDRLLSLQKDYKARAAKVGRSAKLIETIDLLFNSPIITVPKIAEKYKVTYRAGQLILEKLVGVGILSERTSSNRKYYLANEIITATNRD